uniref:Uncharacterized protein n=1 Tax=Timema bartmani TaxID=61472 RepID=A0A7R9FF67_9NEOP|nr:unnamed protein product [Timema bartmani]
MFTGFVLISPKGDAVRVRRVDRLFNIHDAPVHLMFNPYIHSGYRGYLPLKTCVRSVFWWTNETLNIWSHVFGFWLFLGFTMRDLYILNMYEFPLKDTIIIAFLLIGFMPHTSAVTVAVAITTAHTETVSSQLIVYK